jgi:hypothetical protein
MKPIHQMFLRISRFMTVFGLVLAAGAVAADAVPPATTTTRFTTIRDAVFIDLGGTSELGPLVSGPVTITPDVVYASGSFVDLPAGTPDDPGEGDGFFNSTEASWAVGSMTLDFDTPVAAFGATFMHFPTWFLGELGMSQPAVLQAFDGQNGSGDLVGSVTSSGWVGGISGDLDFVGIWSSALNIRSVVLSGAAAPKGYAVDGYALSLTPVPEPRSIALLAFGSLVLLTHCRERRAAPLRVACRTRIK